MTLRLTEDEHVALRERADAEGISMQEAARRAVRDYVAQGQHRDRVFSAARGSWTRTPTRCGVFVNDGALYLDVEDLVHLASLLLAYPPPIRDLGLLGSAAARPQTTVFGEDAYPDVWTKGAELLQSVVKNHALVDGNKRLGWLATAVFLELNAAPVTDATNDDVYDLVVTVAAGNDTVENIATALHQIVPQGITGDQRDRQSMS